MIEENLEAGAAVMFIHYADEDAMDTAGAVGFEQDIAAVFDSFVVSAVVVGAGAVPGGSHGGVGIFQDG